MASGIYLNESVWSSPLVGYNKKQNQRYVGRTAGSCNEKWYSYYHVTARPCLPEEEGKEEKEKNNNKKEKCNFLKVFFLCIFLNFLA